MKTLLLALTAINICFAAGPVGDWHGTLKTPGPELRLVLHVQAAGNGSYSATLDSVDQGANGIPVSTVNFEANKLTISLERPKAGYEGVLSEDGKTLTGSWSQGGGSLPLIFHIDGTQPKANEPPDQSATVAPLLGVWEGAIEAGSTLRVRLTLAKDDKGQIKGSFDSIDQGSKGIPASGLSLNESKFHFDLKGIGGSYDGAVGGETIKGTWRQGSGEVPLDLKKVEKPAK